MNIMQGYLGRLGGRIARALANNVATSAIGLIMLAALGGPGLSHAQQRASGDQMVQLLFVQNGSGVVFDMAKGTLRLRDIAPTTLFFSDRPVRLAGHVHTKEEFLPIWGSGDDSFVKDPPNATVSILEPGRPDLVNVVVRLEKPHMEGKDLVYNYTLIEGKVPNSGGAAAVFIDVLGFWRRNLYRAAMVDTMVSSQAAAAQASAAAASANAAATQAKAAVQPPKPVPTPPAVSPVVATAPVAAPQPAPAAPNSPQQKLAELKSLLNQGFITQAQYEQASQKILNEIVQ